MRVCSRRTGTNGNAQFPMAATVGYPAVGGTRFTGFLDIIEYPKNIMAQYVPYWHIMALCLYAYNVLISFFIKYLYCGMALAL